ncbi:hypothetical protein NPIL_126131 [Nephila pilipes]|uniref:Uncharacterized protein n=1 Tax=Nephila pilipes TaxID=299642 RepID=A0A8X6MSC7_NEPPI|nr:hypothetical protein NPIL_126131 [Nephila pilipes]
MEKDTVSLSFICERSGMASLCKTTTERLELLALNIGARLSAVVIRASDLEDIPIFDWRNLNATDLPSRGGSISAWVNSRWWEGPDWLKLINEKWPKTEAVLNDEEIQRERRKIVASHLTFTKEKSKKFWKYIRVSGVPDSTQPVDLLVGCPFLDLPHIAYVRIGEELPHWICEGLPVYILKVP